MALTAKGGSAHKRTKRTGRPWSRPSPDPRLEQAIRELRLRLDFAEQSGPDGAVRNARKFLDQADCELKRHVGLAGNEEAWAWFHAARREELRVLSPEDLALLEIDLKQEILKKLGSWRREAVDAYECQSGPQLERVVRIQKHLDETGENDNRKRLLQRRQVIIYLALLFAVLVAICALEFLGRGLILTDSDIDGWWVVSALLYGILGGAFSAAQRVAAARPDMRYPELRWAQLANTFRPFAGGAGALVAFAALEADLLGAAAGHSGPRVAMISFVAGFSERFIPSLAARQSA